MPHKRAKRSIREKRRVESGEDLVPGVRRAIEDEEVPKGAARVLNAAKIQQDWAEKKRKRQDEPANKDVEGAAGPSRKKRKSTGGDAGTSGSGSGEKALRIQPGESMAHFNRRVEDTMRHSVREAMQTSSAKARRARKEEEEEQRAKKSGKAAPATKAAAKSTAQRRGDGSDDAEESESDDERAPPSRKSAAAKDTTKPKEFERISSSAPKRLNDIVLAPPQLKNLPRKAKKLAALGGAQKTGGSQSLRDGVLSMAQKASLEEERDRAIRLYREMKHGRIST
ncbi:hypothetical protein C2E23DRAFT_807429 [Lenzites betulinus]|nr:hypothetical protein C2E23DRAFT_807429 [Lenzites betulinus]